MKQPSDMPMPRFELGWCSDLWYNALPVRIQSQLLELEDDNAVRIESDINPFWFGEENHARKMATKLICLDEQADTFHWLCVMLMWIVLFYFN